MVRKHFLKSASIELKKELYFLNQHHRIQRVVQSLPLMFLTVSRAAFLHASHFIELKICVFLVKLNIKKHLMYLFTSKTS